ncbi:MAG: Zn-ribbon-containing protein, partial [Chloroflexales bacterium]|nr:Zn-ribbon-containing protein [Chloroflexales bacterium]
MRNAAPAPAHLLPGTSRRLSPSAARAHSRSERCGDCFDQAPLYRLPKTYDDEYYDIIEWQSNYQACDTLFMNSVVLERATNREMSRIESALSQEGCQICRRIEQLTGVPTYYRVQKHYGRSLSTT